MHTIYIWYIYLYTIYILRNVFNGWRMLSKRYCMPVKAVEARNEVRIRKIENKCQTWHWIVPSGKKKKTKLNSNTKAIRELTLYSDLTWSQLFFFYCSLLFFFFLSLVMMKRIAFHFEVCYVEHKFLHFILHVNQFTYGKLGSHMNSCHNSRIGMADDKIVCAEIVQNIVCILFKHWKLFMCHNRHTKLKFQFIQFHDCFCCWCGWEFEIFIFQRRPAQNMMYKTNWSFSFSDVM